VICGKGAGRHHAALFAGAAAKPLLRVGERGSGEFEEIELGRGAANGHRWLKEVRADRSEASSPSSPAATRARR
jgi:hypothetical protein